MTKPPIKKVTTRPAKLFDPSIVFYRVAVDEALSRNKMAEIDKVLAQAIKLQAELPGMIKELQAARRGQ